MGTLSRALMRAEVLKNLGDIPDTGDTTTRIDRLLHLAQLKIARMRNWVELQRSDTKSVTVTGTPATDQIHEFTGITLREVHSLVRIVGSNQPYKLVRIPQYQWDRLVLGHDNPLTLGDATHYMVWNGQVILYPVPNVNFNLNRRYTIWPADFADDNAVSDLDQKDDIIIARTTHDGFQSSGQREDALQWFAIYNDTLQAAIREDSERPDEVIVNRGLAEAEDGLVSTPWADPFIKRID